MIMRPLFIALLASGCVWETDLPAEVRAIRVDAGRELVITDDAVLGPLSRNRSDGPLSFRHAIAALGVDSFPFTDQMRLIAVANRTDLSVMPDRAADGGEGRLVFALTDGPADDPASMPLPYTVILEYAQQGTAREWTERWHALAAAEDFPAELVALTGRFVERGAISQIRTADARSGPMVMRQFAIENGSIVPSSVRNTPDWRTIPEAPLRDYATKSAAAIEEGTAVMPRALWAASSSPSDPLPSWVAALPAHDALVRGTCGGCHAQGFHIDPLAKGAAKLSRFLASEELPRRTEWMQLMLTRR
jgi:hypothetical protein